MELAQFEIHLQELLIFLRQSALRNIYENLH